MKSITSVKLNHPVTALQFIQLTRFATLFIISIAFAKSNYSVEQIGVYEKFLYFSSVLTFFWINALLQSFLANYSIYQKNNEERQYLLHVLLLCFVFSTVILLLFFIFEQPFSWFFINAGSIPYKSLFVFYLLFSPITYFIEYIYLVRKQYKNIYSYGIISYMLQLILVSVPSFIQDTLYYSLLGLLIITIIRLIWLIYLVKAEFYQLRIYPRWLVKILKVSMPLIVGAFIAGLVPYIDGVLVASNFDDVTFAIFRYGSRELPISLLMANAMSNAMVPVISSAASLKHSIEKLKKESIRLMHILFPISIILMLISTPLFRYVFNPVFIESAGIFKIMLLLVISRVLFPQTILLSFRKNNQILTASVIEVLTKIVVSIIFLKWWGLHGIVWGTVIAFFIEKVVLIYFVYKEKGILPSRYIHFRWWAGYTILLLLVYFFSE